MRSLRRHRRPANAERKNRAQRLQFGCVVTDVEGLACRRDQAPGKSNENGVVEQRHSRTKSAVAQALVLRSKDFDTVGDYEEFARGVVEKSQNRHIQEKLAIERKHLQPLPSVPSSRVPSFTTFHPMVRGWSTVNVNKRTYSVPSRLIGHEVEARQHPDVVEIYFRSTLVETMPRLRGSDVARIDYRHVIWSLVKKPGAFAQYKYREELFPSLVFRKAYDALKTSSERGEVEYVRILHLAASTMESQVEKALAALLERGGSFDYAAVKAQVSPDEPAVPEHERGPIRQVAGITPAGPRSATPASWESASARTDWDQR